MALIPPTYLDTVVAVGIPHADEEPEWVASGFLLALYLRPGDEPNTSIHAWFLVTNRHVLDNKDVVFLRFNPANAEPARFYTLPLRTDSGDSKWFAHPNPDVDVAVATINVNKLREDGIQYSGFWTEKHVFQKTEAEEAGISEGDRVFVLGFPMGIVGEERNYVIVRSGVLARIRDWYADQSNEILVDTFIFPGNSGGPVITKPETISITGTKANTHAKLLGIVSGYIPYHDVAVSLQTGRPRVSFEENSGLAAVHPVDLIIETARLAEDTLQLSAPASSKPDDSPDPEAD